MGIFMWFIVIFIELDDGKIYRKALIIFDGKLTNPLRFIRIWMGMFMGFFYGILMGF